MKTKILLVVLTALSLPTIALGGTFTYSLIQGKTPAEAVEIIATELDRLIGRVEVVEEKQIITEQKLEETETRQDEFVQELSEAVADLDSVRNKNTALKDELQKQAEQADIDRKCAELKFGGPRRVTTKQPIDEMYEALTRQHNVSFEDSYAEYVSEEGEDAVSESEYREEWDEGYAWRGDWLSELKPFYDEYIALCRN
ncbi:MAG: hypothetical protein ACJKTH_03360 [Patescibacteria group bacterium UBA2163]